jgi:hypothetical protein
MNRMVETNPQENRVKNIIALNLIIKYQLLNILILVITYHKTTLLHTFLLLYYNKSQIQNFSLEETLKKKC